VRKLAQTVANCLGYAHAIPAIASAETNAKPTQLPTSR
jgi:hypothetical protein